jgi:CheY-like chemotaxis protein
VNFTKELLHQIHNSALSVSERARLRCQLAKQFERVGNYEAARDAMGELWGVVNEPLALEQLDQLTAAEVLLRTGVLTGYIGTIKPIARSQEIAKDRISESIAIFELLHDVKKTAEAQTEIAVCYGREGALENARVMLAQALTQLDEQDGDLYFRALLRSAIVEKLAGRLSDALNILTKAAPMIEASTDHILRGSFHNELGNVLRRLGVENGGDYIDRAAIEYAAASFHFEQASHMRYQASAENNFALLYLKTHRVPEAHERLDRAQTLFTRLNDTLHLAEVEETRARVMLAEGTVTKAERIAQAAVRVLEHGGQQSKLAEALITHGIALSRLSHEDEACTSFKRAFDVAERASDLETAGIAALILFEQLADRLTNDEICETLDRAHTLLKRSKNPATRNRLGESAFRALSLIHTSRPDWTKFSLEQTLHGHEARYIQMALEDAGGVVSRAARLLGLSSYQKLQYMLKTTHKDLRNVRTSFPEHELTPDENANRLVVDPESRHSEIIKILHIEDDPTVAAIVQELTQESGWELKHYAEGASALDELASDTTHYDLLLVAFELPDVNGLELIERVRSMFHRRYLRIVIMSGTLDEAAAREAGADAFLQKPQGLSSVVQTISRLLDERDEPSD